MECLYPSYFSVIQMWLGIWAHSPKTYRLMKQTSGMVMPSERLLTMYKNCLPQDPGIHDQMLAWMYHEAKRANLPDHGHEGGLIFDEMSIQV